MRKMVSECVECQGRDVAGVIGDFVREKPGALLCLAAGDSATAVYGEMVRLQKVGAVDFRACRLILLDEWVGLSDEDEGGCFHYIRNHVIRPLGLPEENVFWFDACADDLLAECVKANEFLEREGPIDLSLMGVGMNGHIALNEPGCDLDGTAHTAPLDVVTMKVAQKYFEKPTPVTHGITLGMKQIWDSCLLIIIANGERKRDIMRKAMYGEVTNRVPASALQNHKNCIVSLDREADSDW